MLYFWLLETRLQTSVNVSAGCVNSKYAAFPPHIILKRWNINVVFYCPQQFFIAVLKRLSRLVLRSNIKKQSHFNVCLMFYFTKTLITYLNSKKYTCSCSPPWKGKKSRIYNYANIFHFKSLTTSLTMSPASNINRQNMKDTKVLSYSNML